VLHLKIEFEWYWYLQAHATLSSATHPRLELLLKRRSRSPKALYTRLIVTSQLGIPRKRLICTPMSRFTTSCHSLHPPPKIYLTRAKHHDRVTMRFTEPEPRHLLARQRPQLQSCRLSYLVVTWNWTPGRKVAWGFLSGMLLRMQGRSWSRTRCLWRFAYRSWWVARSRLRQRMMNLGRRRRA
jgi:hypothetical protein